MARVFSATMHRHRFGMGSPMGGMYFFATSSVKGIVLALAPVSDGGPRTVRGGDGGQCT